VADIKKLSDGNYVIERDGIYRNPATMDQFQFRRGQIVPPAVAGFQRIAPWPGEQDELSIEERAITNLENRALPEIKERMRGRPRIEQ